jgi:hypothetical protein
MTNPKHLTRADILARKIGKGIATLPDGSTVAIRALTRDEVLSVQEEADTIARRDTLVVAAGMTDPKLSVEDVTAWAASAAAGDITAVSDAIAELSGLGQGAGKSGVRGPRGESGS